MRFLQAALLLAVGSLAVPATPDVALAPLHPLPKGAQTEGGHIVVLKDGSNTHDVLTRLGIENLVSATYSTVLKGFAGQFNAATLGLIRASPLVDFVEYDTIASTMVIQRKAPYNLAIDSQAHQLEPSEQNVYRYSTPAGYDVGIYILDSGVNINNTEFGGRARNLVTYYDTFTDVTGHGTNVAGIAAGKTYGPAKDSIVYNVKVLGDNGRGPTSKIISGIDYSVTHCNKRKCIINMSLGGPVSDAENRAVAAAFNAGILVAAAAGNENQDACNVSPASSPQAFTVAAVDSTYTRANFSNFGSCVNIFAPGVDIVSAGASGPNAISTMSGTSQATPGVAGIAAYFLGALEGVSASQQSEYIYKYAMKNLVSDPQDSSNVLANNGFHQGAPG